LDLINHLEEAEQAEKLRPSYQKKMRDLINLQERREKESRRERDAKEKEKEVKNFQDAPDEDTSIIAFKDEPLKKYSFIKQTNAVHIEDREYWIDRIKVENPTVKILVRGLERGIAVHHDALPIQYRTAVEALFRAGHLRVVISTGTLSLGINMPCKTVVFAGDYPSLNPLTFQQMSGRAGRRGYDDFGDIVFFGIPKHRVFSLVSGAVTTLVGSQPITPSICLRSIISYNTTQRTDRPATAKRIEGLLNPPLFLSSLDEESAERHLSYTRWLYRIYIDYLYRLGLITRVTKPVDLAELASNLFFAEPANFLLCHFLLSGVVDRICESSENQETRGNKLLHLLCYLIKPFPITNYSASLIENGVLSTESDVILSPLDPKTEEILNSYHLQSLELFTNTFRKSYSAQEPHRSTTWLPFSEIPIGTQNGSSIESGDSSSLLGSLRDSRSNLILRSPFVALSGHYDRFRSAGELATTSPLVIPIEADHIPSVVIEDIRGRRLKLSSYALDFFKFGSKKLLVNENGLKENVAWELLRYWVSFLGDLYSFPLFNSPELIRVKELLEFLAGTPSQKDKYKKKKETSGGAEPKPGFLLKFQRFNISQ